jgi:hypothetical protein
MLPGRVWRSHWTLPTRGAVTAAAGGTRRPLIRERAHAVLFMLKSNLLWPVDARSFSITQC